MVKLALISLTLGIGLAFPASGVLHAKPSSTQVEQRLLHQMNAGPDGTLTKSVRCLQASGGGFSCTLHSTRSTSLGAHVAVSGGSLETVWQPLRG